MLPREFFDRPGPEVAPDLLGCVLRRDSPDGPVAVIVTEVEAYAGPADPASHSYRGRTPRNAVMFGPPGHAYVYFTYGMHFCANLVCEPPGRATAVLLRAGRVIEGAALAAERRTAGRRRPDAGGPPGGTGMPGPGGPPGRPGPNAPPGGRRLADRDLARGPGRLCQALSIDRDLDGADACDPVSPLRICPAPEAVLVTGAGPAPGGIPAGAIRSGPRIGISRAADWPWRFWIDGEPSVSSYRPFTPRRRSKPVTGPGPGDGTMQP